MSTLRSKLARWADGFKLAGLGLLMAARKWRFWVVALVSFVLFGTLLGMLAFPSSWTLLFNLAGLGEKLDYLARTFLSIFELRNWPMLVISVLQALIIGLIALSWWKKRRMEKEEQARSNSGINAGIVTGLAVLAGGCPTCGTSLLAPLIGAIFSGSSAAVGETVSWVLTLVAIVIAILTFRKIGEESYVIMVSEKRRLSKNGSERTRKK